MIHHCSSTPKFPLLPIPQLIMAPEFNRRLRLGDETADAARGAYDTGLAACFLLGSLEMLALPFVDSIRKLIPRAAMLAAIAGVSLTFIAMGFAVQACLATRRTPPRLHTLLDCLHSRANLFCHERCPLISACNGRVTVASRSRPPQHRSGRRLARRWYRCF